MINKLFYKLINAYHQLKSESFPQASGTFIQPDMVMEWDDAKWQRELSYLKEVKVKYIVINTFIVQNEKVKRVYKTSMGNESRIGSSDIVDMCLKNCEKAGFKVFLGIDYNILWWKLGSRNPEWLYRQMEKSNLIIEELYKKYHEKYKNAFHGWYWVYEVDNLNFRYKKHFKVLANAVNINLEYMDNNNIRLPLMLSPFMNSRYSTPRAYANNWRYFFKLTNLKKGDIFCPQDSVGGGGLDIKEVRSWFAALSRAVKSKEGLLFWANVETFDHHDWSSAPIKRFIKQMRLESPFVDDIITFAYSHYYSPNNISAGFHIAYKTYLYKHEIYNIKPDVPKWSKISKVYNGVLIQWETSRNIAGYKLYCNGKRIYFSLVQRKYGGNSKQLLGECLYKNSSKNLKYEIQTVDFWGNISTKSQLR
ncbi:hypothetical protein CPAST_c30070 [Clostridium pasteurianum DSM 525 = ATCC 6013]|uniref:DUF4434 domain-containing protein n=1 Tax=Clostridium pasteurianum DSM 525 = ATCC 6013 TaxID=1262449 RepID=A0A0H3J9Y1_CLOPA|nr:DUF4434 domain-containing protein [Clostridium pasteurianum]AJA49073.1 hypothetical protein CPAST_c30070 [Clostridium pasteurianum DSM 525 = ATCC 6013]AJA53061.1 hypothetical protein CLPA_c30070 [Clostridium pasteurianum DSM 525 = ATCC 6013]AOZ76274.1 hypothetical protein AQ983_14620 [Clostridium pasteurianum DSM 525 = ATCC 6013]AOZ80070.1 hypothetical protein AQ984_14615 [Clostridium pasteurianum]ELP59010.1 hypothetical protein F502_10991 [Clostridium pasteurianum DSM 525 = ATCC 6013]